MPTYRIQPREHEHGDLYELEIDRAWDVINEETGEVVMTFSGESSSEYKGGPGWEGGGSSGVTKVELAEDGASVRVYHAGKEQPEIIALPV